MTALRRRLREERHRRGLAPRPHPGDVDAVKPLTPHDRRAPAPIRADALRQDFRFLINDTKVAERTCRMHLDGIRGFDARALQRPWPVFALGRPRHRHQRPVVLRLRDVWSFLAVVEHPNTRRCLQLLDAGGLRLTGGTPLQVSDSAAPRRRVRVHQGHGGNDRLVPRARLGLE